MKGGTMTDPIDVAGLAAEQMRAARRFDAARQEMAAANEAVHRSQWLTSAAEQRRQRDAGDELRNARRALRAIEARYAAACDTAAAGLDERDDGQQELAL